MRNLMKKYKNKLNPDKKMKKEVWSKIVEKIDDKKSKKSRFSLAGKGLIVSLMGFLVVAFLVSGYFTYSFIGDLFNGGGTIEDSGNKNNDLIYADSCSELKKQLKKYEDSQNTGVYWMDGAVTGGVLRNTPVTKNSPTSMSESALDAGAAIESSGPNFFTTTNVQVEGIDEGDIVKTDGKYLYVMKSSEVVVMKVFPTKDAQKIVSLGLEDARPIEMLLYDNKLVVFSWMYSSRIPEYEEKEDVSESEVRHSYYAPEFVYVSIFDVEDKKDIELERELYFSGDYQTSRMKDGYMYLVTNEDIYDYDNPVPTYMDTEGSGEFENSCLCEDVAILDENYVYPMNTNVTVLNLNDEDADPKTEAFVGMTETVYMSNDNLFLVSRDYGYGRGWIQESLTPGEHEYKEKSVITKLTYDQNKVEYDSRVDFEGHLLNQFSLDEYEGYLRIAGTEGDVWGGDSENFLMVFDKDMDKVSEIGDLAKGEKIYSARFYGNTGVIVTFKKVDPLFVFDLSDPEKPVLEGELKIPGYSDYLHFWDEDIVIGLGKDTVAASDEATDGRNLDFAWYQGLKLALFDISDPNDPKGLAKMVIGDRGSDSQALHNHKAFVLDRKHNRIILPVSIAEVEPSECGRYEGHDEYYSCYGDTVWQGAYMVEIDKKWGKVTGMSEAGRVTHYPESYDGYYSSYGDYAVKRNVVIDDVLVSISDERVKLNDIESTDLFEDIDISD